MVDDADMTEAKTPNVSDDKPEKSTEGRQFLAEDFKDLADNIYEAIIAIAKRARQIGDAQKKEIDKQIGTLELAEQPEEEPPDEDVPEPEFYHYEKPTVSAMKEMADGRLKIEYTK
jgi:DNA-directed RNA polymerase subunit K/omega